MPSSWTDEGEVSPPILASCGESVWSRWVSYWTRWGTGDHSICYSWAPFHFTLHFSPLCHFLFCSQSSNYRLHSEHVSVLLCVTQQWLPFLMSAQTIWADGWGRVRQLRRNGNLPNVEWVLALSPAAPQGKAIKVKRSWANSWQEQELMFGQGQEKHTHIHIHTGWKCYSKQGQKALGNANVVTKYSRGCQRSNDKRTVVWEQISQTVFNPDVLFLNITELHCCPKTKIWLNQSINKLCFCLFTWFVDSDSMLVTSSNCFVSLDWTTNSLRHASQHSLEDVQ